MAQTSGEAVHPGVLLQSHFINREVQSRALFPQVEQQSFVANDLIGLPSFFQACSILEPIKASSPGAGPSGGLRCDKCDGAHSTSHCPHFRKGREEHEDAWQYYSANGKRRPSRRKVAAPRRMARGSSQTTRMPGDGSCLFHSLAFGLRKLGCSEDGHAIRQLVARFIAENPDSKISGTALRTWVYWDSRRSVNEYVARLSTGGVWGGAIEMAVVAHIFQVDVVVYEKDYMGNADMISDFLTDKKPRGVIMVLYLGRMHYDAIEDLDPDGSRGLRPPDDEEDDDEWTCALM